MYGAEHQWSKPLGRGRLLVIRTRGQGESCRTEIVQQFKRSGRDIESSRRVWTGYEAVGAAQVGDDFQQDF